MSVPRFGSRFGSPRDPIFGLVKAGTSLTALAIIATFVVGCQPETVGSVVSNQGTVLVQGPDYAARAEAAWKAAPTVSLSEDATSLITKMNAPIVVDVATAFRGITPETKVQDLRDPTFREALMGTDEAALSTALRATGARLLIVHSAIGPSLDRDKRVLSRLVHHDDLHYFELAGVEDGAYVYLLVDKPLAFPPDLAGAAIHWVREVLEGKNPAPFPPQKAERKDWNLVTTIRGQGQELSFSLAQAATLDKALIETVSDLESKYRRDKEILGFPRLDRGMGNYQIEMHRITERAWVVPRSDEALEDMFELGMDGAILIDTPSAEERKSGKNGQSGVFPGSVAAVRGYTTASQFLKACAREFKWDSVRPWRDEGVALQMFRDIHWVEVQSDAPDAADPTNVRRTYSLLPFHRGTAPVPLESVNLDVVKDSVVLAGEWYLNNLKADGAVTYKYWPEDARFSNEDNHVRHALATWNLWQAWSLDPRPEFIEGAVRAQNWTLQSLQIRDKTNLKGWELEAVNESPMKEEILEKGIAYYTYQGNTKLGSIVVGLLGMVEVARSTNNHQYDDLMRQQGRFVQFMQRANGSFSGYHVPKDHPYYTFVNDIVPGEAALSLIYLSEYFNDPSYLTGLPKFFEYYEAWYKERAAKRSNVGPWPAYIYDNATRLELVQFGPWTVMAASAYTRVRPDAHEVAAFGLDVGKWMIEAYEYTEDNAPFPDYVGGYYKFQGELPAMQAFCYGEGTAAAYDMALRMAPTQAAYFEKHTRETVRFGLQMQHDGLDTHAYSRPELVIGGTKYAMNEPKVRIDYVHHSLSAMYQYLVAARKDPNLPAAVAAPYTAEQRVRMTLAGMPSLRPAGTPGPQAVKPLPGLGEPITVDSLRARAMQVPMTIGGAGSDEDGD